MPIGLNYTHEKIASGILLPSYAYILDRYHPITRSTLFSQDEHENKKFRHYLQQGYLKEVLHSEDAEQYFDARWIREILLEAYPYEIDLKCLRHDVEDDLTRNQHLITLFNNFFDINYEQVLTDYITSGRKEICARFLETEDRVYTDKDEVVALFMHFLNDLLRSQGYQQEAVHIYDYMRNHLHLSFVSGISGVTSERDSDVYIEVGNNTYITLLHELVHFVNRYFRYHYYEQHEVCFDHYTRTNEGLSNFVAYHLIEQIINNDLPDIEHISTETLFVSSYIDVYATLREEGSTDREHNIALIHQEMQKFEGDLLTPEKLDFYIQRFYKFFHYDQHTYFYPKELMYHIGYHHIREMFATSSNKAQLLTQCLLGKICL